MGFESFVPWLSWSTSTASSSSSGRRDKKKDSKAARTRAQQVALNGVVASDDKRSDYQYYPGLVNISGTYCFMNSTLQALASLTYLQPHIDAIHAKAEALDVPTPIIDALQELFKNLNTPKSSYHSLRPTNIISALSSPPPPPLYPSSSSASGSNSNPIRTSTANSLFNSREHQDAQELFQLVSECIKNEMISVDREGLRDRGIAGVLDLGVSSSWGSSSSIYSEKLRESSLNLETTSATSTSNKSVFDGLTANRRSCVICGYTEAVMHFGFDNWQLAVPRLATSCRLEDCLEDYTRLEILNDCICRKCSVLATQRRLAQEIKNLQEAANPPTSPIDSSLTSIANLASTSSAMPSTSTSTPTSPTKHKPKPSASKKKRLREVKKMEQRVRTALEEGRIEDETLLKDIRLERVFSPASTKQAMIARPPPVLALHLNRSVHYGDFAAKNTIRVGFPEVLDLTPFTTSGSLSTVPTSSISTPSPPPSPRSHNNSNGYVGFSVPLSPQEGDVEHSMKSRDRTTTSSSSSGTSSTSASTRPTSPPPRRSTTPTPASYAPGTQRTLYRLSAVVCHYGQHSFGHYICYRRKPVRGKGGRWVPPTLVDPLLVGGDEEGEDEMDGSPSDPRKSQVDDRGLRYHWLDRAEADYGTGRGWLRISDDDVRECGIESVLQEGSGVFMLYYEKVVHPRAGIYARGKKASRREVGMREGGNGVGRSGRTVRGEVGLEGGAGEDTDADGADTDADRFSIGSEETLKPEMKVVNLNGSVGSLISEIGVGVMKVPKNKKEKGRSRSVGRSVEDDDVGGLGLGGSLPSSSMFGARVVRSVNARRSLTPSLGSLPPSSISPSSSTTSSIIIEPTPEHANGHGNGHAAPIPLPPNVNGTSTVKGPKKAPLADRRLLDIDDGGMAASVFGGVGMASSAPSVLSTTKPNGTGAAGSNGGGAVSAQSGKQRQQKQQQQGLGSKSTRVMHQLAPSTLPVSIAASVDK